MVSTHMVRFNKEKNGSVLDIDCLGTNLRPSLQDRRQVGVQGGPGATFALLVEGVNVGPSLGDTPLG